MFMSVIVVNHGQWCLRMVVDVYSGWHHSLVMVRTLVFWGLWSYWTTHWDFPSKFHRTFYDFGVVDDGGWSPNIVADGRRFSAFPGSGRPILRRIPLWPWTCSLASSWRWRRAWEREALGSCLGSQNSECAFEAWLRLHDFFACRGSMNSANRSKQC